MHKTININYVHYLGYIHKKKKKKKEYLVRYIKIFLFSILYFYYFKLYFI